MLRPHGGRLRARPNVRSKSPVYLSRWNAGQELLDWVQAEAGVHYSSHDVSLQRVRVPRVVRAGELAVLMAGVDIEALRTHPQN